MSIIYTCICYGENILCEHFNVQGNFTTVVKKIIKQIPKTENEKMSYSHEKHFFHYWVKSEIVFLCIADDKIGRRIPFAFLDDIQKRWRTQYGDKGKGAQSMQMQLEFSRILKQQMDYYSNDTNADRIREVNAKMDEVKGNVKMGIEKLLERGERIELLIDKTENLNTQSFQMKKKVLPSNKQCGGKI